MQRPEYPSTTPSIQVWEEACVISQEWADDAREAAIKRRNRNQKIRTIVFLTLEVLAIAVIIYLAAFA